MFIKNIVQNYTKYCFRTKKNNEMFEWNFEVERIENDTENNSEGIYLKLNGYQRI